MSRAGPPIFQRGPGAYGSAPTECRVLLNDLDRAGAAVAGTQSAFRLMRQLLDLGTPVANDQPAEDEQEHQHDAGRRKNQTRRQNRLVAGAHDRVDRQDAHESEEGKQQRERQKRLARREHVRDLGQARLVDDTYLELLEESAAVEDHHDGVNGQRGAEHQQEADDEKRRFEKVVHNFIPICRGANSG